MLVFLYLLLFGPALISAQTFDEYGFDEYGLDALGYDQNGKCASEFYPQVKANVNYTGSYCTDYKFIDSIDKGYASGATPPSSIYSTANGNSGGNETQKVQWCANYCGSAATFDYAYKGYCKSNSDGGGFKTRDECRTQCKSGVGFSWRDYDRSNGDGICECCPTSAEKGYSTYESYKTIYQNDGGVGETAVWKTYYTFIFNQNVATGFVMSSNGYCYCSIMDRALIDGCPPTTSSDYNHYTLSCEHGYNDKGYNRSGIFESTGTRFDTAGYDKDGYNSSGYNSSGYNSSGYNSEGYDSEGYDIDGYGKDGFNVHGLNATYYNRDGVYAPIQQSIPWYISDGDDCTVEGERIYDEDICEEALDALYPNIATSKSSPSSYKADGVSGCSLQTRGYDTNGNRLDDRYWWITPEKNPNTNSQQYGFIYGTDETFPCYGNYKEITVDGKIAYAIGRNICICKNRRCPANTYQDEEVQQNCKACPPGRYSNKGSGNCPFTSGGTSSAYEAGMASKENEKSAAIAQRIDELKPELEDGWTQQNVSQAIAEGKSAGLQTDMTNECDRMRDEFKNRWSEEECTSSDLSEL